MDDIKDDFFDELKSRYGEIYIFGAGRMGQSILSLCKDYSIDVRGFLVSNALENKRQVGDISVLQSDDEAIDRSIPVLIAVMERGKKRIKSMLSTQGYLSVINCPDMIFKQNLWDEKRKNKPVIEVTSKIGCAVNCKYCPQSLLLYKFFKRDKNRKVEMSLEDFIFCLDRCPKDTIVDFSGFVEPFLNQDSLEMMRYCMRTGHEMTLFTTLCGLDVDSAKEVVSLPFDLVCLHLPDKNGFASIPLTEEYYKVLHIFLEARKTDGSPFVDYANSQFEVHPDVLQFTDRRLKIYCEMMDRAGNLDEDGRELSHVEKKGEIYCGRAVMLNHNVLLPDGSLALCCNDFGLDHILGNLFYNTYEEIMKGEELRHIKRSMHIETDHMILCRKCVFAETIQK